MLAPVVADRNMTPLLPPDEDIIEFLRSTDFDVRLQTLSRLTAWVKSDPQWFSKFIKKGDLFKQFERLLMDDRWEVQHQCIKFLHDVLPTFGNYLEWCITYLLPTIVTKLGNPKITIRRITNQMLIAYLKLQPTALNIVQKVIANFLLDDENDAQIKDEALREIPNLLITECANQNWKPLISCLAEMMHSISSERHEKIIRLFAHFNVYLGTEKLQKILSELTTKQYEICNKYEQMIFETDETMKESLKNKDKISPSADVEKELRYRFGIIPIVTSNMLNNDTDPTTRIAALEQVSEIMNGITTEEARKFAAHLHSYFLTLGNVLDDLNFKVVALCLDVLRLTLEKVGSLLAPYTQQIVGLISKHFGNQKSAIKQQIMAISMITMKNCSPKNVISHLCVYSEHRNSRIREEILNIMTAALLKFDSRSINLKAIADVVVPLLADQKRRVRLASFELFAVLAHLSSNSTKRLLKSVSNLEQKYRAYGLLNAVKERISRKTLPKIRSDGLIEYAIPLDVDISMNREGWRRSLKTENLDYEWIMSCNNGSSSIFSRTKWPSVSAMGELAASSIPISVNTLAESNQSIDDDEIPWKENFSETLGEFEDENIPEKDAKAFMNERPCSDDSQHFKLNGNGTCQKYWNNDNTPSHTMDRIRLEKLQNLKETTCSDSNIIHKNATKELNDENFGKNGFAKTKHDNLDGNSLANNISQNGKFENPDDLPIKSSEYGDHDDNYAPSEPLTPTRSILSLVRKSFSHQNLAFTSKTTGIHQHVQASSKSNRKDNNINNIPVKLKSASSMRSIASNSSSIASISRRGKCIENVEALLKNPESSLNEALQKFNTDDWNGKLCGIEVIAILAEMSPAVVAGNIHPVVMKLLSECKNLRSTVSRAAISSFGVLFENLKIVMDSEIEKVCFVLMQKAGDVSNAFIRDDATVALEKMIKYVSPGRCLNALVAAGAKSKSNTIRACCANLLVKLMERVGPINAINSTEFSCFVTSLLLFAKDANATVRRTGKYGIRLLSQNNELFDDAARKSLNENERQNLREVMEAINRRGLEENNFGSSSLSLGSTSRSSSVRRSASNGRDASVSRGMQQDLLQIRNNLIASEWERRMKGLKEFSEIVMRNDRVAISDTKVLEAFVARTSDINFKVSVEAMETLITILPKLSLHFSNETSLKAVLYQLVNSLMSHLASRSEGHRQHAKLCFEEIIKYIENLALLAPFAAATKQANVKQRPFMLHTLSKLMESVYSIKPRQAEAACLPVLWELLKIPPRSCSDPEVRDAIRHYAVTVARCVGIKTLLELSTFRISLNQKKTLQKLIS